MQNLLFQHCVIKVYTAKQKDGLTSFLMLSVLEAKIFQYGFLEEHKMYGNSRY